MLPTSAGNDAICRPSGIALGLHIGRVHRLRCFGAGRVEAEGLIDHRHVLALAWTYGDFQRVFPGIFMTLQWGLNTFKKPKWEIDGYRAF